MKRNQALSFCRILATLFILVCHIIKYYTFIPGHLQLGQFFNIGVPMFIIISGYLYGIKSRRGAQQEVNIKKYVIGRYVRVALPSQIWAIIIFTITLGSYAVNTLMVVLNIQGLSWIIQYPDIPNGGPYLSHSWFVTVILICYVLVPVLNGCNHRITWRHIAFLYIMGIALEFVNINIFYFLLFVVSFYVSSNEVRVNKLNSILIVGSIVLCIAIRLAGHEFLDGTKIYNDYITTFTHQISAAAIIILCSKITEKTNMISRITESKIGEFIEQHSYSIYLVHYSLIPIIFSNMSVLPATIAFLAATAVLALGLDLIAGKAGVLILTRV